MILERSITKEVIYKMWKKTLLLCTISLLLFHFWNCDSPKSSSPKLGNTPGNILNGGFIAENEDFVFISYPDYYQKLLRQDKKSLESVILCSHAASFINIWNNWIYFISYTEGKEENSIIRMKLDGSEEFTLAEKASDMHLAASKIFYISNKNILSMNLDGTSPSKISQRLATSMAISGNRIFFQDKGSKNHELYSIKLDGSDEMLHVQNCLTFIPNDKYIYYKTYLRLDDASIQPSLEIFRLVINDPNPEVLVDHSSLYFNLDNENLYYTTYYKESSFPAGPISKVSLETEEKVQLIQDVCHALHLVDDWIYFVKTFNLFDKDEITKYGIRDNPSLFKAKKDGSMLEEIVFDK